MAENGSEPKNTATKSPTGVEMGAMSGPLVSPSPFPVSRKVRPAMIDAVHVVLRLLCLVTSVVGLSLMVTAKQTSSLNLYGFQLPVYSHWSFSDSFEYLVGVSAAVAAHSLLQLGISMSRFRKKAIVIPSQNYAWVIYAGDQIFAYAMMSAGSAASGVTSLNRTGIRHTALPDFCKPLHAFCNRVAASIAFAFLSCLLLAASAVLDIIWLTCY
ncbi:CASP-like protein 3A1 [Amaranthus tricolor]|uniref:CASP-like protein 3A1 n=1 Tax=Amaranthus tricolor TaxID=29722 RepID=UPI00258A87EE|nr:CASP-like protein 3A1 [Amaranthus tricolor]